MTLRQPIGALQGRGGSHRESSLLPIGRPGVIYNSKPYGYTLFMVIQIRAQGVLYIQNIKMLAL
jgi:hypothetical protein